ncbi:MAG: hypothetical protein HOP12_09835, partial [Candidatus Eisenbacteria bacterium]|nr:hypothetical protein [Candidatus Eisenbacteria bacterium]
MSDERMTSKPTYEGVTTRRGLGTPARGGPGPWLAFLLALALVAVAFLGVRGRTRAPRGVPAPDSTR